MTQLFLLQRVTAGTICDAVIEGLSAWDLSYVIYLRQYSVNDKFLASDKEAKIRALISELLCMCLLRSVQFYVVRLLKLRFLALNRQRVNLIYILMQCFVRSYSCDAA